MINLPTLYRYEEAADILGVTLAAVKWYAKSGRLLAIGHRRSVLINGDSLRHFMARRDGMPDDVTPNGYIYLMRFMKYHKIGLSIDANKRLRDISPVLPEPVTLIHTIPTNNMYKAETQLHFEYAHCRARGEWFKLTAHEVRTICSIKALLMR